ncbi:uncharacterized protein N0V89_010100 [Didymosphaeria variabile]|uniref:Helicase C-terminal domain-containing protein n=1 Tax=Didymosphaeria variabile TaxID=1932322 RepID=A0A9W8XF42_9PLEO|nr:uncharacterized protein N0V89_010100 [Didymosphaeria variabile]KAJ4348722.1 hypothetical protein N0V89_010100 [Didymosphaeria variabile]
MSLLQRLFMAFTIIRPKDSIVLPPRRKVAFELTLPMQQANRVEELTDKYRQAAQMSSNEQVKIANGDTQIASALGCAIQAQVHQLHPGLTLNKETIYDPVQDFENVTAEDLDDMYASSDNYPRQAEARSKWLADLEEWSLQKLMESAHLNAIVNLIHHISDMLGLRVVIFAQYLRYQDLVDRLLRHRHIVSYRYDGSVASSKRARIQANFEAQNNSRPLLMTVGAGGIGLNLTEANIMILCDEMWNDNEVAQAISRLHRQGQDQEVLVLKFAIPNSAIDLEIIRTRENKVQVNTDLLKPLITKHDAEPVILKLLY